MTSQFDLTRFYDVIMRNSVFKLSFLTREFQIPRINYRENIIINFNKNLISRRVENGDGLADLQVVNRTL